MKAVSALTMQDIDRQTITGCGISGLELMEQAGTRCVEAITARFGADFHGDMLVMAGKGNNGGDGFVIARLMLQLGWRVTVCLLADRSETRGDALVNLTRLPEEWVICCRSEHELHQAVDERLCQADLIVDAIFGTGLNTTVSGVQACAIALINAAGRPVLAVDIPSGVDATSGGILGSAIRADMTVTFGCPKLGHVFYPGAELAGRLTVADIGIPARIVEQAEGCECLDRTSMLPLLKQRDRLSHKGRHGHCLIVAGSPGKTGAAALCANSAVRAGAGLVSLAGPQSLNSILEIKTTEAMTIPLADDGLGHITADAASQTESAMGGKQALAIGPGIGRHPETTVLARRLMETADIPMVIDADGLNALAVNPELLLHTRSGCVILTPHPGEMARLTGEITPGEGPERIAMAKHFAVRYGVYLILKGARTIVAAPDGKLAINTSGNPGMAAGGMGDVLTGIITALCGQGYSAWDAVRLGVFIHGFSADLVAGEKGEIGITATDVIEKLPYAFKKLGTGMGEQETEQSFGFTDPASRVPSTGF